GSFLLLNYSALCLMGFKSRNSFPATNLTFGNWGSSCLFGCLSETRIISSETQNVHLRQPSNSNSRELKQQRQQRFYEQNNSAARASHFLHISLTYTTRLRCKAFRLGGLNRIILLFVALAILNVSVVEGNFSV
ncbi:unnamed protein product, partial [Porites lobata]